jgi:hypothetical protein
MSRRYPLTIAIMVSLFLAAFSLAAQVKVESFDVRGGVCFVGNAEENSAPSPLVNTAGIALPIRFTSFFSIAPELDFYLIPYGKPTGVDRPVPVEIEQRDRIQVLTLLFDPAFVFSGNVTDDVALGGSIHPGFFFRIPTLAYDDGDLIRDEMTEYFYSYGRFFSPGVGVFVNWRIYDNFGFSFRTRVFFPLSHAFDKDETGTDLSIPFYDNLIVSATVGFRFLLGVEKREEDTADAADASEPKPEDGAESATDTETAE